MLFILNHTMLLFSWWSLPFVMYIPFVTVLICISPSCIKIPSQISLFPQTKASAHAVVWSLQIKDDTPTPCACRTAQHLQPAAGALPPQQPLCMQPLQAVNVFSTVTSRGFRATGPHYVTQASLRGFEDWSPQEPQAVYRDCRGHGEVGRLWQPCYMNRHRFSALTFQRVTSAQGDSWRREGFRL